MELKSTNKAFGGEVRKYTHASTATGTDMTFSVYVPPVSYTHLTLPTKRIV